MTVARARNGAAWVHLVLAGAVVAGVFAQVYLIGAYVFGAGRSALDAHESVGWAVHSMELLVALLAIVAWMPRRVIGLSVTLAVVGTAQVALASATRWTGALHPLGALVVMVLAGVLVRSDLTRRRTRAAPASARRG
jgi:Family of unknown function (DUF6220)